MVHKEYKDLKVYKEFKVYKDSKVLKEFKDQKVLKDSKDSRVLKVFKVFKDLKGCKVLKGSRAHKDGRDSKVPVDQDFTPVTMWSKPYYQLHNLYHQEELTQSSNLWMILTQKDGGMLHCTDSFQM